MAGPEQSGLPLLLGLIGLGFGSLLAFRVGGSTSAGAARDSDCITDISPDGGRIHSGRLCTAILEGPNGPGLTALLRCNPMSEQRGAFAAQPIMRPVHAGMLGVLVLIEILRLVILLGWRDGGRSTG